MIFWIALFSIFTVVATDGWSVSGYKPAYTKSWNQIIAHDTLIDILSRSNKSDKNRWYFVSPPMKMPAIMTFTLTAYVGKFNKLNDSIKPVKIGHHHFPHLRFNGSTSHYVVQFIPHLWIPPLIKYETVQIEILGDWTQGNETVGLSNVKIYY